MRACLAPLLCVASACSDTPSGAALASTQIMAQISTSPTISGQVVLGLAPFGAPPNTSYLASCLLLRSDAHASANGVLPTSASNGQYCGDGVDGTDGQCYQPSFEFQLGSWPSMIELEVADPTATRVIELTESTTSGAYTVARCDFTSCSAT